MTHDLYIADRLYSSWSLRGWLMCDVFGIPHRAHLVRLYGGHLLDDLAPVAPAKTVPALKTAGGAVLWDSLAIGEELAQLHPDAGLWPADPIQRATARSLVAEMHSGFMTLRSDCPMNLLRSYRNVPVSADLRRDLDRIEVIWHHAMSQHEDDWLCGAYSLADVFFAPVAMRIAGYGLAMSEQAQAYVARHLAHPALRRWRALGLAEASDQEHYVRDYDPSPWPGPAPLPAMAAAQGPSVNATCPYSGGPVSDFLTFEGRVFGFCNPTCRDKTVTDPAAWPGFMALTQIAPERL